MHIWATGAYYSTLVIMYVHIPQGPIEHSKEGSMYDMSQE